jgi:hypothetical protein
MSAAILSAFVVLDVACDGGNGPRTVETVEVTPATVSFTALDQTENLTPVARDADGGPMTGVSFTWGSSDPLVASVNGAGVVTAVGNDSATITATADGKSGTCDVIVEQVASQVAFNVQPVGGKAGEPLATQPTVQVQDANANAVASDNTTEVTVAIEDNPSGGTLSGNTAVTAASGEAVFTDLSIDIEGVGYTLTASASGFPDAESNAFSIGAEIDFITVSPEAVTLVSLDETVQLTAEATSTTGREIPGVNFSWSSDPTSVCTVDASGLVTAEGNGASCTVTAAANSKSGSAAVTVRQEPARLGFSRQPEGGKAEEPLATQPTVQVQDAEGNLIADDNTTQVTVAIEDNPSGGTLSGSTTVTAASGETVFTDLSVDIEGVGYTLTASSSGLTDDTSDAFKVSRNVATVTTACPDTLRSIGETGQCAAEARSPSGRVIPDPDLAGDPLGSSWSGDPTSVCTVDATGLVTAVDNGDCTVKAEADGVEATSVVTVKQEAGQLSVSPNFAVLALAETRSMGVEAFDARDNPISSPDLTPVCRDPAVASVSGADVTGEAAGVTDCVWTSGAAQDSARFAVVAQKGFAAIVTTSQDSYGMTAASGATAELDFWMIRPTAGDGDLGSIQGSLVWDPNELTYDSSIIVESGWTWIPNETNVGTGTLGFAAFSATGTADTFVLARVTFTASGASGGGSALDLTVTAAGDSLGADITSLMQAVSSLLSIE